ncbi:phosphatase PAP2 family protein [Streptomyces sp. SID11385]|uniref:phosphatase PAP2 family protein n=1 Tax=Streptomyces sp. SID11385 TaxID=2706031 RepID=UPI0013C9C347|nr:phosphatase PAP2 family protein [Streptomyces sp. SID11385]
MAVLAALVLVPLGGQPVAVAAGGLSNELPRAGGYWSASYEPGTSRPAGFPAAGTARNVRGETAGPTSRVAAARSDHANATSVDENVDSLFDQDSSTKWYASGSGRPTDARPVHVIYALRSAQVLSGYSLTSANDAPPRDPAAWTVLGSNSASAAENADDSSWRALGEEKDQRFAARGQSNFYALEAAHKYRYYQLRLTDTCADRCEGAAGDRTKLQLADWTLRGLADGGVSPLGVSVENADSGGAADGSYALRYAGRVPKAGPARSSVVLRSGLDVLLGEGATLSWAVRPQDAASAHVSVDLVHTDANGRHTRVLTTPQAGRSGEPAATPDGWRTVSVDLGALAGRRVTEVRLRYDDPAAKAGSRISGWIDDIRLGKPVLDASATWDYLDAPDVDPAAGNADRTAWTRPGSPPGGVPWKTATGPFGVKNQGTDLGPDFPVRTRLNLHKDGSTGDTVEAYFFRTDFTMDRATIDASGGLVGTVVHDDTVTVYLNGRRLAGRNDGAITKNLQYQTPEGTSGQGDPLRTAFVVPASALRAGTNTLAVEVHQCDRTSSDAYFRLDSLVPAQGSLPFTDEQLSTVHDSDRLPAAPDGGDYFTWLLRPFTAARDTPSLMGANEALPPGTTYDELTALNDRTVIDINNAPADATDPEVHEALIDGRSSPYRTMADGLGTRLGALYSQALENGELPRTEALLSGRVEHTPGSSADWYQTAKNNYQYKRPFVRMGFADEDGLVKPWDSRGGYDGLAKDGSFPSGHTSHGYAQGIVLATLLPELAPQILARASEYGEHRILLAFHYPTDIMGGRIVGERTAQGRWSDPGFRTLLEQAQDELRAVLAQKCRESGAGGTLAQCIAHDRPYLPTGEAVDVYTHRLTYGFPRIGTEGRPPAVPAGAEDLLRTALPKLSATQRRAVLAATQLPSGYALDEDGAPGSWQRLNLAAAMSAKVGVHRDGTLTVNGVHVDREGMPTRG